MNKLIMDIANEKIFLMIITKDDIYNITKENTKTNYEKLTLIIKDFLNSNKLKIAVSYTHLTLPTNREV